MTPIIETIVDSRARIRVDAISPTALAAVHESFTHTNPAYFKKKQMGYGVGSEKPQYKTWSHIQFDDDPTWWLAVARGGLRRLCDVLNEHGYQPHLVDQRIIGRDLGSYTGDYVTPSLFPAHNVSLWAHQGGIVDAISDRQNCVIRAPTGSGKSTALIASIAKEQLPTLVIVWDSKLMVQWQERIEKELGIARRDIGIIRGAKRVLNPITIGMQQTLNRFKPEDWAQVAPAFGYVACDEVQRYSAETFVTTIDRFPARFRVGVSADETRKDKKEFLIYDMFGKVAHEVSKEELEQQGVIHNVEIRVVPTQFKAGWYVAQRSRKGGRPDHKLLLDRMTHDAERNELATRVAASAARTDPTFVFTHRVNHAKLLDTALAKEGIKAGLLLGGDEAAEAFEESKRGLRAGTLTAGVGTYQAIGVGQDIPNIAVGVCTTPMHTNRQLADQVKGRICRKSPGKLRAIMYYLWDQHVHGHTALKNLRRWNRTVSVLSNGEWIPVTDYLESHTDATHKESDRKTPADDAGIFS